MGLLKPGCVAVCVYMFAYLHMYVHQGEGPRYQGAKFQDSRV